MSDSKDQMPRPSDEEHDELILWMLSLTPSQRLKVAQEFVDSRSAEEWEKGSFPILLQKIPIAGQSEN